MSTEEKTEKSPTLMEALRNVPESQFWQSTREELQKRKPNYSRTFGAVAKEIFAGCLKSTADLIEAISAGDRLNLSSFQRAVAKEAERRKNPDAKKPAAPKAKASKKKAKKSKLL